jgi:hypothetical protein
VRLPAPAPLGSTPTQTTALPACLACLPVLPCLPVLQLEYTVEDDLRSFGRGFTVFEKGEHLLPFLPCPVRGF